MASVKDVLTAARNFEQQGQTAKAKKFYQAVADRMPGTKYAAYSKQQLTKIAQRERQSVEFDLDAMEQGNYGTSKEIEPAEKSGTDKVLNGVNGFVAKISRETGKLAKTVQNNMLQGMNEADEEIREPVVNASKPAKKHIMPKKPVKRATNPFKKQKAKGKMVSVSVPTPPPVSKQQATPPPMPTQQQVMTPPPIPNVAVNSQQSSFNGDMRKCPNCGQPVGTFDAVCPACGYEFHNTAASNTMVQFSNNLQMIESGRAMSSKSIMNFIGKTNNIDEQMAEYIRNFPVPNTKEDTYEFMVLAASNIDESIVRGENYSLAIGDAKGKKLVNQAWYAKFQQIYNKAKISFGNDKDFARIQEIYDNKINAIKAGKEEKKEKDMQKAHVAGHVAGKVAGGIVTGVIKDILPF